MGGLNGALVKSDALFPSSPLPARIESFMRRVFAKIVLRPLFVFGVLSAFACGAQLDLEQND